MAKLTKCKVCGATIASSAKVCPSCGAKNKKSIFKRWWFWLIVAVFVIGSFGTGSGNSKKSEAAPVASTTSTVNNEKKEPDSTIINLTFDTAGYSPYSVVVLRDYASYMIGEKVVTAFQIGSVTRDSIKAKSINDELTFPLICEFASNKVRDSFNEKEMVTIAGTINKISGKTVYLDECVVVGHGEMLEEIDKGKDLQIQQAEAFKKAYDDAKAEKLRQEREEYAASCEKVNYKEVERNPDSFKGKRIKVTGKVIQVAEGWLDSVTLRVDEGNGNTWYVTYTHKDGESRILENDRITCYGECKGVESYTSVLGSQVTIPSMKMEYFE